MLKSLRQLGLGANPSPQTPDTDFLGYFVRKLAGMLFPAVVRPDGIISEVQTHLARKKVALWNHPGSATTNPGVFGCVLLTIQGTVTARNVTTSNYFSRRKRLGYVSAATAGSFAGARWIDGQYTIGTGSDGGFLLIIRFGCSDAVTVAGARQFVGMAAATSTPTDVEPDTLINSIGVGHGTLDTNLKLYYAGSTPQTPIDLGADFPANTLSTDMYELMLFAKPTDGSVGYRVERLNTGHVAEGTLAADASNVSLPSPTNHLLAMRAWRCNHLTPLAVALDFVTIYMETDA